MKVSELADDLDLPVSAVLAQCQRFGIDASWVGAELNATDVVILRAELAGADDALDLTEPGTGTGAGADVTPAAADPPPPPPPPSAPPTSSLPPTAVGSMPDLIDAVTPPEEVEPDAAMGFRTGGHGPPDNVREGEVRRVAPRPPPDKKTFDRRVRNSVLALLLAIVAFWVSNIADLPAVIAVLWLLTGGLLVMALVDSFRGRRLVQTHPERLTGVIVGSFTFVFALAGLIGLGASVVAVVGDTPAADSPASIGELSSVQHARWGYLRLNRIMDNGWKRPARDEGTCWKQDDNEVRKVERVEVAPDSRLALCSNAHMMEVGPVFAVDRNADSPYPGEQAIKDIVAARCGDLVASLAVQNKTQITLRAEYPTKQGWDEGDHDVACVLVTDVREGALID